MAPARLSHVFLLARDFGALVDFYHRTLGLALLHHAEGEFAFLDLGGPRLAIYPGRSDADTSAPHWFLVLDVDDVEAAAADLRERGVEVEPVRSVPFGRAADLADPEGNRIELHQAD
ncbi:MAG: VOC family protein [Planctomycetota bacterium]|nr:VOC family protein [Planctomycetota bacterium]